MSTLQVFFISLAAALMLFWLIFALRGPQKIEAPDVLVVLRYSSALRVMALVLAWAPLAVTIYVVAKFTWRTDTLLAAAGVSFMTISFIAGMLLIEAERMQIAVTETGIIRLSPWTGRAELTWSEVGLIQYSPINRWFVVVGAGRTIRLSRHLVGIGEFVKVARGKLAVERYLSATAIFNGLSPPET